MAVAAVRRPRRGHSAARRRAIITALIDLVGSVMSKRVRRRGPDPLSRPRFSIVIPTRDRPATLRATLASCLRQTFGDFEVVVSDNFGGPATRALVEELNAPQIRYVRTPEALALADSWEFAVSHASGEVLTLVGDDDAVLPYALEAADTWLRRFKVDVIRANELLYVWPKVGGFIIREGTLLIQRWGVPAVVDSVRALRQARRDFLSQALPSLYNSFVARTVLDRLRSKVGRVFNDPMPDWYTGCAIPMCVDGFLRSGPPLRIAGVSAMSTGRAIYKGGNDSLASEYTRLNSAAGLGWNPKVPRIQKSDIAMGAETMQQAIDCMKPAYTLPPLDRKRLLWRIVTELGRTKFPLNDDEWRGYVAELRRYVQDDRKLQSWLETSFPQLANPSAPHWTAPALRPLGWNGDELNLDLSLVGVSDVSGAAEFFGKFFPWSASESADGGVDGRDWRLTARKAIRELTPPLVVRALARWRTGRVGRPS